MNCEVLVHTLRLTFKQPNTRRHANRQTDRQNERERKRARTRVNKNEKWKMK